ncbi:YfhO family protein [bacterium]|nr:YfhO family protein [candidate division CSSED10-310 bacterium]
MSIIFLTTIFFFKALVPGKIFFYLDHVFQNIPFRYFAFNSIKTGHIPLWCPFSAAGFPIFAEGQSGISYPVNWMFYLTMPFSSAYNLSLIAHVAFMCIGFYLLFRRIGYCQSASLSGSISIAFSGYFIRKLMFVNYIQAFSWMPWLFYILISYGEKENCSSKSRVFLGSFFLAMTCLAGHPQVVLFSLFCFWLLGLVNPFNSIVRNRFGVLILISILGLLLACWQLIPTSRLMLQTNRGDPVGTGFSTQMSMPPSILPVLFINDPFGNAADGSFKQRNWPAYEWELSCFIGITVCCLAIIPSIKNKRVQFYWSCVILGIFLAIGQYALKGDFIYHLPVLSNFRAPVRWIFISIFGFAGLCAHAVHEIRTKTRNKPVSSYLRSLSLIPIIMIIFLYTISGDFSISGLSSNLRNAIGGTVIFYSLSSIGILTAVKRNRSVIAVFPVLIFLELYWAGNNYFSVAEAATILNPPRFAEKITDRESHCLSLYHDSSPLVEENWHQGWSKEGLGDYPKVAEALPMYSGLIYKIRLLTFDEWSPLHYRHYRLYAANAVEMETAILRNFNVRYVLAPRSFNRFRGSDILIEDNRSLQEISLERRGTRVSVRHPVFTEMAISQCLQMIKQRERNSSDVILRSHQFAFFDDLDVDLWAENALISSAWYQNDEFGFHIEVAENACIMVAEAYDSGWRAFLRSSPESSDAFSKGESSEIPVLEGDLFFQSCIVPAGSYDIRFRFLPLCYRFGLFLTSVSLLVISFLQISPFFKRTPESMFSVVNKHGHSIRYTLLLSLSNVVILSLILAGYFLKKELWLDTLTNWFLA